jgi:hypothetical protein
LTIFWNISAAFALVHATIWKKTNATVVSDERLRDGFGDEAGARGSRSLPRVTEMAYVMALLPTSFSDLNETATPLTTPTVEHVLSVTINLHVQYPILRLLTMHHSM